MKLIIASNNEHKLIEIRQILGAHFGEILSMREAGIEHETVEDGASFAENAAKKAREIMELSGCCALADDSGLCVDALGGAPGIFSARFAGEHGNDAANRRKLLEVLKDVDERAAHFTCSMVLARPDGSTVTAEGYVFGVIARAEAGENGFGYDSRFFPRAGAAPSCSRIRAERTANHSRSRSPPPRRGRSRRRRSPRP